MIARTSQISIRNTIVAAVLSVGGLCSAAAPSATAVVLGAGSVALAAGSVAAQQNTIPGVGVIVKKNPGSGAIVRGPSNKDGIFNTTGLQPGSYSVTVGNTAPQDIEVPKGARGISVKITGEKNNYVGHVTLLR